MEAKVEVGGLKTHTIKVYLPNEGPWHGARPRLGRGGKG